MPNLFDFFGQWQEKACADLNGVMNVLENNCNSQHVDVLENLFHREVTVFQRTSLRFHLLLSWFSFSFSPF